MSTEQQKALVVFATITGNNEAVADLLIADLEKKGLDVTKSEISQTEADELSDYDIVAIVPYTYDQGSLPDEGLDFYDDLAEEELPDVVYGIAGSGDLYYGDTYCLALDDFDKQMAKTGAQRAGEIIRINLSPSDEDAFLLDKLADHLIEKAK
ncbi:flavodoxin domain-containing protein [Eupransor demetentiae]|uniref:Flavodoxin (FldA) n=1 Tax=Eupransor demetentiae TaxID=3109584 RepID=A0ABM9N4R9_9LACO|nr:Flavodoxin (FldA) [Lactobacillaceae bacterium LMG 33000]